MRVLTALLCTLILAAVHVVVPTGTLAAEPEPEPRSGWSLGKLQGPGGGTSIVRAVTAGPRGFVAVGERCTKRRICTPAAWTSVQGKRWRPVDVDERERRAGEAASLYDVTWGPGGYVAVGKIWPPSTPELAAVGTGGPEPVGAAWRSRDGRRWSRVVVDSPFSGNPTPSQIVATDKGYLVLSPGRSMVVTSRDGKRWRKHRVAVSDQGGTLAQLAPLGQGYAAIGFARVELPDGEPSRHSSAVWRSGNGKRWTPQIVAGELNRLGRLASIADRVVVVQGPRMFDEHEAPRGGFTRTVTDDGAVVMGSVPGADGLYAVGAVGDRFIVAGMACGPALWVSDDGVAWARVPWSGKLPAGASRWHEVDIAADDRRVVIAGTAEVPDPDRPRRPPRIVSFALTAPSSAIDLVERADTGTCATSATMPTAILTSADGTSVEGLPARGCWAATGTAGDLQPPTCFDTSPAPGELPVLYADGDPVTLRLALSDGSTFTSASLVEHDTRSDMYTAGLLVSTDGCESRDAVDFKVARGRRILYAWIAFDCAGGSAEYRFMLRPPPEPTP